MVFQKLDEQSVGFITSDVFHTLVVRLGFHSILAVRHILKITFVECFLFYCLNICCERGQKPKLALRVNFMIEYLTNFVRNK